MKIDNNIAKLICELEFRIGSQCYNPNSYDGWTGDEGCEYRYPVNLYPNDESEDAVKIRGNVSTSQIYSRHKGEFGEMNIRSMKYKFGSNHLFIGEGLIDALQFLEERYSLDFNALEEEYRKKNN